MKMKLLPWISFHHDHRLMVFRPRGIVDEPHVEKTVAMLEQVEQGADQPFDRYTDLSKLDAVDLSFEFIFRISLHRRLAYSKYPPVKSAFYVTSPATFRVARAHAILTDRSPLKVRWFKEVTPAAKWLGVPIEDLEI
jgi:hypothetical protein